MAGISLNFVIFIIMLCTGIDTYKLNQVLILSRHNIRTPLTAKLENLSPYKWPVWKDKVGHLTAKGALLETLMGEYFIQWLRHEKIMPFGCPNNTDVFVYANTKQRTRESANAFVRGAFKNCNITAYSINSNDMDPIFNPILRDTSEVTKIKIMTEMSQKLNEINLSEAYIELNEILDIKNSDICKKEHFCDLLEAKDEIVHIIGEEPNIKGPLAISNNVLDSFIMSYYERMPDKDVAWGKITKPEQWTLLSKIIQENQNVRFNSTTLAMDVAKPLLNYIKSVFNESPSRKVTIMFGHDSNLNSVMSAMDFQPYILPNQYEATPPGGKIVFQKWHDEENNREYLKVDYVYQTTNQLRNNVRLSNDNPPQWVKMEIKLCNTDNDGYCSWEKFQALLNNL